MGYLDSAGLAHLWSKIKAKLVQPDWSQNDETAPDYVKNRPGGYDGYDLTITWDGVIGNRLTVPVSDTMRFVKVSNFHLDIPSSINDSLLTISNGEIMKISDITSVTSPNVVVEGGIAFVSTPGWVNEGVTFPESGIYFGYAVEGTQPVFVTRLQSFPHPVKIPQKYLELDAKADKLITTEATLPASGWMGGSAPYIYNLSVTGVTADSHQELLPALDITAEQLAALQAANIQDGGQSEDTVTLKAFGTKPTIDLPIRVLH